MKNIVLVCAHKDFEYKLPDIYKPIVGGACLHKLSNDKGFLKDNVGDNISSKNPYYSELTALYWAYKHLDYQNLGLVHYRRYFKGDENAAVNGKKIKVLSNEQIDRYLSQCDLIVPKKRHYVIETLYSHYCRTLRSEPMYALEEVIKTKYPDYLDEFNNLKKRRNAHMFNMLIARKDFLLKYLDFLFDILNSIEDKIDSSSWNSYEKRYMGSVAELVLDIYLRKNNISYKEIRISELIPFVTFKKGVKYLKARIFGKKYLTSDK